jgi:hypothetical protein
MYNASHVNIYTIYIYYMVLAARSIYTLWLDEIYLHAFWLVQRKSHLSVTVLNYLIHTKAIKLTKYKISYRDVTNGRTYKACFQPKTNQESNAQIKHYFLHSTITHCFSLCSSIWPMATICPSPYNNNNNNTLLNNFENLPGTIELRRFT